MSIHLDPVSSTSADRTSTSSSTQALAEQVQAQAKQVIGTIPLLGAVCWLMMQHTATRHTLLSELQWRVMPALVLGQAKLYLRGGAPLAYVSWARLSPEIAARYQMAPHHLAPADWRSGEQVWIVDFCAPFGGGQEILRELQDQQFAGQTVHRLNPGRDAG